MAALGIVRAAGTGKAYSGDPWMKPFTLPGHPGLKRTLSFSLTSWAGGSTIHKPLSATLGTMASYESWSATSWFKWVILLSCLPIPDSELSAFDLNTGNDTLIESISSYFRVIGPVWKVFQKCCYIPAFHHWWKHCSCSRHILDITIIQTNLLWSVRISFNFSQSAMLSSVCFRLCGDKSIKDTTIYIYIY